jgi:hypothetical protein
MQVVQISREPLCMIDLSDHGYTDMNDCMNRYIYSHPEFSVNVFKFRSGFSSRGHVSKYSSFDVFGKRMSYYVLDSDEARQEFSEFLLATLKKRQDAKTSDDIDLETKMAFNRMMHEYNLHSELCHHNGNPPETHDTSEESPVYSRFQTD